MINIPEKRFIPLMIEISRRRDISPTPPLSNSHHAAEPKSTPTTSIAPVLIPPLAVLLPAAANMAAKEMMVIGFVRVRPNVLRKALARPDVAGSALSDVQSLGVAHKVE